MFQPNQRIVCIDADFDPRLWEYIKPLVKDAIYTVRDLVPGMGPDGQPTNAVYLHEITNSVNAHGIERGYAPERFAPLQPTISITTKRETILV
jgi:hypothetical protein